MSTKVAPLLKGKRKGREREREKEKKIYIKQLEIDMRSVCTILAATSHPFPKFALPSSWLGGTLPQNFERVAMEPLHQR